MQKIKERLFGVVVLFALGILFVPMLFPQSHKKMNLVDIEPAVPLAQQSYKPMNEPENIIVLNQIEKVQMSEASPDTADPEQLPAALNIPPVNSEPLQVQTAVPQQPDKTTAKELVTTANDARIANANSIPANKSSKAKSIQVTVTEKSTQSVNSAAWVVQVGTFRDAINANKLVSKLQKDGLPAYTRTIKQSDKALTLVFVGPKVRKQDADALKESLQSKYRLDGFVRQHVTG